jgi:hypothetical protein
MVLEILSYALEELDGELPRSALYDVFGHLLSRRQVRNFLEALERIDLADPADTTQVPPQSRHLNVSIIDEAINVLQYHPDVTFHEKSGRLIFGPKSG